MAAYKFRASRLMGPTYRRLTKTIRKLPTRVVLPVNTRAHDFQMAMAAWTHDYQAMMIDNQLDLDSQSDKDDELFWILRHPRPEPQF